MKIKFTLYKGSILSLLLSLSIYTAFGGSPQLVWYSNYGDPTLKQKLTAMVVDNYDNMFAAGYVNFGNYANIIINRYDGVGQMMWNRMYGNQSSTGNDSAAALFPDYQGGVTLVGIITGPSTTTHIIRYDGNNGNVSSDVTIGNTSAGSKTFPVSLLYDGTYFYIQGQLNNVSKVFKCDNSGNILWSTSLHNDYNNQAGSMNFDHLGNLVVAITDSSSPQVLIHRYYLNSGIELPVINTHLTQLPVNGNNIHSAIDNNNNIFIASTGADTAARSQWIVNKFDTSGTLTWSTMCNSSKGYSNRVNSFLTDYYGDVLISGPCTNNTDTLQYAAVYKISGDTGSIVWSTIDSLFLVNEAITQIDLFSNVYFTCTRTPSTVSPLYSNFACSQLSPDSGLVQWYRSFDNSESNTDLIIQANNFGDLFLATSTPTDKGSGWFAGRVGNAANDSIGTAVKEFGSEVAKVSVFPNPFTEATNISITVDKEQEVSTKLFDAKGQMLQQLTVFTKPGKNNVALQTSLSGGVYFLRLESAFFSVTKPLVIY